ncbi:hypothetical protein E2320_020741, partial [Naja naja]
IWFRLLRPLWKPHLYPSSPIIASLDEQDFQAVYGEFSPYGSYSKMFSAGQQATKVIDVAQHNLMVNLTTSGEKLIKTEAVIKGSLNMESTAV